MRTTIVSTDLLQSQTQRPVIKTRIANTSATIHKFCTKLRIQSENHNEIKELFQSQTIKR